MKTESNANKQFEIEKRVIAEIIYRFSMNQDALEALQEINSNNLAYYFDKFKEIFVKEVHTKTGIKPLMSDNIFKFKTFSFSFNTSIKELNNGRGKLLFISNDLGNIYENPEGKIICSNKYIILSIEQGILTRWMYMHLTGRLHEPRLFLLNADDIIYCGSLPDDSFQTLFNELDRRLVRTPSIDDLKNLLNDFY